MKISKEKLLKHGNESLALSAIFSVSSLSCPCPICIGSALMFFVNSIKEKLL